MRRTYDAVKVLGMRDDKIAEEFADQKSTPLYGFIEDNTFKPFNISNDVIAGFEKLSEEKNIPNPLDDEVLDILENIQDKLFEQQLNKPFVINEEDYLIKDANQVSVVPPLPEQPMPNAEIVQQTPLPVNQTGLTITEQALLSEEEKMIKLRDRGMV